ncbi:hypothetical protein BDQ17DRAFT_1346730 [Cyathus striatus]|nr:hypothetical protein BDQ17DRAFT_1346730 [Cyathus striatus]
MAPAHSSRHSRNSVVRDIRADDDDDDNGNGKELFVDPMHGTSMAMYVDKDVADADEIAHLIVEYGGTVGPGYSGVPYILVDPHKESGQNIYRQFIGKKGKLVLDARWIRECIKANQLQTYVTDWAGCKVTGKENTTAQPQQSQPELAGLPSNAAHTLHPHSMPVLPTQTLQQPQAPEHVHPTHYPYPVFAVNVPPSRVMESEASTQTWQTNGIVPQQTQHQHHHIQAAANSAQAGPSTVHHTHHTEHTQRYRENAWDGYAAPTAQPQQSTHQEEQMEPTPTVTDYDYRYREQTWPGPSYYDTSYGQAYGPSAPYMNQATTAAPAPAPPPEAGPSEAVQSNPLPEQLDDDTESPQEAEPRRGRRRQRTAQPSATPAANLVANRNPRARSPTPPSRVIKSTYGGNLFTVEDVLYLKKYIDYCQEQGLVLSLREICERIAIRAPHHTFYSWRRYCNKHQIRLGGYVMAQDRSNSPDQHQGDETDLEMEDDLERELRRGLAQVGNEVRVPGRPPPSQSLQDAAREAARRNRSPTPPRALYRSTTGKGVAFTEEDVLFLVKFMEYRKVQGKLDMVKFWKDVAIKAPHHSRASWMKFWRRHKHELERSDGDAPLPQPPEKKMRYSREDDILLARYFYNRPSGTSDKIFQEFGRLHPHHPWKGWQEHHRIHKQKIDHLIELIGRGIEIEQA